MAKRVIWLLSRDSRLVNEDGAAGEAITPGHLVKGETTILKQTATTAIGVSKRFALEREEMGKDIDTAYAIGDTVKVGSFAAGDRVNAFIASGQNITAGGMLESAGDGTLKAYGSGTPIARALETSGAVTVLTRLRAEILIFLAVLGGAALLYFSGLLTGMEMTLDASIPDTNFLLMGSVGAEAAIHYGRDFMKGAGKWATEQFVKSLKAGKGLTTAALRTADTLRKDEWIAYDTAIIEEGKIRLKGVADLIAAGLVTTIPNGLAKTLFQYEKVTDMEDAIVSMSGVVRSENDRPDWSLAGVPLPITHKDFNIDLRHLEASRLRSEGLDVTAARVAGRKCGEMTEQMLFSGGKVFGGFPIYGYTTHPNRNAIGFGAGGAWTGAKTGAEVLLDVQSLVTAAQADLFYGPYVIYTGSAASMHLSNDFKATTDKSIRSRLLEMEEIVDIRSSDKMPAATVVLVQLTSDVVTMLNGEDLQTVQWDLSGGFEIAFKAFQIFVPLLRSDADGRMGLVVMS